MIQCYLTGALVLAVALPPQVLGANAGKVATIRRLDPIEARVQMLLSPSRLSARYSPSDLAIVRPDIDGGKREIDVRKDIWLRDQRAISFQLNGDSVHGVAALVGLGPIGGSVALALRRGDSEIVAYSNELIEFPPPFFGGPITAIQDFTGDGIPEIVIKYFGGDSYHMRIFRWDGASSLSEMEPDPQIMPWFNGTRGVGYRDVDGDGIPEVSVVEDTNVEGFRRAKKYFKWNGTYYELFRDVLIRESDGEEVAVPADNE